jgi:hypothetical protein
MNKLHKKLFLLPIVLVLSCSSTIKTKRDTQIPGQVVSTENLNIQSTSINVEKTIGIVTLSSKVSFSKKDTIRLLNQNGSTWFKFSFYYDDSDGKYDFMNDEFKPYAFNPDYFKLGLVVSKKLADRKFLVIVNHEKTIEKIIEIKEYLEFRRWDEYLLSSFAVGFNALDNPLLETPAIGSKKVTVNEKTPYHPIEIKGEWLKVRWKIEGNESTGWIKWKRDGLLIVSIFPYA